MNCKYILLIIACCITTLCFSQKRIYPDIMPGEEILIERNKVNVSGSLMMPDSITQKKSPVVIFISGSGDFSYRSHFHPNADYTYCKELSELLLSRGIAVFFIEKRGINRAGGDWKKAGFNAYAADVAEAIHYLKQRPEIDANQIGLLGHSQGGYIGQVVAAENTGDIAFFINLVGPAQSVHQQILFDMHNQYTCRGYEGGNLKMKMSFLKASLGIVKLSSHVVRPIFLSHVIRHKPEKYIPRIQCPMLSIYAENDYMVDDVANTQLMTQLLWNSNDRHWIYTIEGVNHQFLRSELCYNWDEIDKTVHPELFRLINLWIDNLNTKYTHN